MMDTKDGALWSALPMPAVVLNGADQIVELNVHAEVFFNLSARAAKGKDAHGRIGADMDLRTALARVRRDLAPLFVRNLGIEKPMPGGEATTRYPCNLQISPLGENGAVLLLLEPLSRTDRFERSSPVKTAAQSAIGMSEMLAHEIKNPLAGISGAAQLLSMGLNTEDRELTDLIVEETKRIVELLQQVEQFGNLRPPQREIVNVHDLLDRARQSSAAGFARRMLVVEDYDPSLPATYVDKGQIIQVLLNLIKNASEAAERGEAGRQGTLTLRTFYEHGLRLRRDDGSLNHLPLQIEVIDDGPGLPEGLGHGVFDPFVSGRENGTGLGLALVSKIITEHEGLVDVESRPGRTVFRLSLPVAPTAAI